MFEWSLNSTENGRSSFGIKRKAVSGVDMDEMRFGLSLNHRIMAWAAITKSRDRQLINSRNVWLTFPEAGSLRSEGQDVRVKVLSQVRDFSLCPHVVGLAREPRGSSF